MHELSIALSILEIAQEESERQNGARVAAIYIKLGPLSGIVQEALLSAYELARECSPFNDCELVIEEVPVVVYCARCQAEREIESIQMMRCAACGTLTGNVVSGREMEIVAMEFRDLQETNGSESHENAMLASET